MILRQCAFVICLLAGFVAPLHSQIKSQPAGPVKKHFCPQGRCVVDLCLLAYQLDPINDSATMMLEAPRGVPHRINAHDEIPLSYDKKEQIIFTCKEGKGFQIAHIHRVWDGCDNASIPDMPFDLKGYAKLRMPQKPGAQLPSGPPVAEAVGYEYKFSFIIAANTPPALHKNTPPDPPILMAGKLYDPHIIVTGPGDPTGGRKKGCISPSPTPTPGPHKDEKSSSQKGGAGGSIKR